MDKAIAQSVMMVNVWVELKVLNELMSGLISSSN
jgi:hypothetical protein